MCINFIASMNYALKNTVMEIENNFWINTINFNKINDLKS